jgi:hypothetical protein
MCIESELFEVKVLITFCRRGRFLTTYGRTLNNCLANRGYVYECDDIKLVFFQ